MGLNRPKIVKVMMERGGLFEKDIVKGVWFFRHKDNKLVVVSMKVGKETTGGWYNSDSEWPMCFGVVALCKLDSVHIDKQKTKNGDTTQNPGCKMCGLVLGAHFQGVTFCRLPTYFPLTFSDLSPYFLSLSLVLLPQDCPIVLSWSPLSPFIYS